MFLPAGSAQNCHNLGFFGRKRCFSFTYLAMLDPSVQLILDHCYARLVCAWRIWPTILLGCHCNLQPCSFEHQCNEQWKTKNLFSFFLANCFQRSCCQQSCFQQSCYPLSVASPASKSSSLIIDVQITNYEFWITNYEFWNDWLMTCN